MGTTTSWVWANGEGDNVGSKFSSSIGFIGIGSSDETIDKDVGSDETIDEDVGRSVRITSKKNYGMGGPPIKSSGVDSGSS
jgi:hypothetical protein